LKYFWDSYEKHSSIGEHSPTTTLSNQMTTINEYSVAPEVNLSAIPANVPSLCIPRVFKNITRDRIFECFNDLNIGVIDRIDMVHCHSEKGDSYFRVFIHLHWNRSEQACKARARVLSGKEIKIVYDAPWFWKVTANRVMNAAPVEARVFHHSHQPRAVLAIDDDDIETSMLKIKAQNDRDRDVNRIVMGTNGRITGNYRRDQHRGDQHRHGDYRREQHRGDQHRHGDYRREQHRGDYRTANRSYNRNQRDNDNKDHQAGLVEKQEIEEYLTKLSVTDVPDVPIVPVVEIARPPLKKKRVITKTPKLLQVEEEKEDGEV